MSEGFDRYKHTYSDEVERSISFIGAGHDFFIEAKARKLLELVERHVGDPGTLDALHVGCGEGKLDGYLRGVFARLTGCDLSPGLLDEAAARGTDGRYLVADGTRLPFADGSFDVTFTANVLHHVPPAQWASFSREMARVTEPGGLVTVFEHNPFNPLTRLAVARCSFDEDVVLLRRPKTRSLLEGAGLRVDQQDYILFFPWDKPVFRRLERKLTRFPMGAQYLVAARRPHRDV